MLASLKTLGSALALPEGGGGGTMRPRIGEGAVDRKGNGRSAADGFRRAGLKEIGVLSAEHRVSLRTLRFYEDRGLISPVRVGTRRLYSDRDEVRLRIILVGKRLGFSLAEIERLILSRLGADADDAEGRAAERLATGALTPEIVARKIAELERARDAAIEALAELKADRPKADP